MCLNNLGFCYKENGNFEKGIENYNLALTLFEEVKDSAGIGNVCNNIGLAYYSLGDIELALKYYERSILIREALRDHKGIGNTYNNLGLLYHSQHDTVKALECYRRSMNERAMANDHRGVAQGLNNIGVIFDDYGDYDSARYYYTTSYDICAANKNYKGMFTALANLGGVYKRSGNLDSSLICYRQSLALRLQYGSKSYIAKCEAAIASVFGELNQLDSGIYYGERSLKTSLELNYPENISTAAEALSFIYEKRGNYIRALEMYKLYIENRDRISNEESQAATTRQQAQYKYDKQKLLDDATHANELTIEAEKQARQRIIIIAAIIGLILVVAFLIFVFNRLQLTRKQKLIIEEQKHVVETAHHQLGHKNKEILDSINYARRIQNAILPPEKVVSRFLPSSFVLYKPKDIVAGDFYWLERKNDATLFAVADCTGHGVPGALVSVFCNNGLNRSVREHGLTDPAKILEKTRDIVMEEFGKSEEQVLDGMDISLCSLQGNQLLWAGANIGLFIVRNGALLEYKADKQPIGKYVDNKPFTTHRIDLQRGDMMYMFSDGFADQFGGPNGKKFKVAQLRELLLKLNSLSMSEQKKMLDDTLRNWRGEIEQIDDVCVWGVKIG